MTFLHRVPRANGHHSWYAPVLYQPMEDLDEGEDGEERHKFDIELITEDCHGQTCFDDGLAYPLIYSLHLSLSEGAQEDLQAMQGSGMWC